MEIPVEIVGLLVSPTHAYEGRPDDGPRPDPDGPRPACVEVHAGLGLGPPVRPGGRARRHVTIRSVPNGGSVATNGAFVC